MGSIHIPPAWVERMKQWMLQSIQLHDPKQITNNHPVVFNATETFYKRIRDFGHLCREWWSSTPIHGTPDMVTLIRCFSVAKNDVCKQLQWIAHHRMFTAALVAIPFDSQQPERLSLKPPGMPNSMQRLPERQMDRRQPERPYISQLNDMIRDAASLTATGYELAFHRLGKMLRNNGATNSIYLMTAGWEAMSFCYDAERFESMIPMAKDSIGIRTYVRMFIYIWQS